MNIYFMDISNNTSENKPLELFHILISFFQTPQSDGGKPYHFHSAILHLEYVSISPNIAPKQENIVNIKLHFCK